MSDSPNWSLTASSRSLQAAALKNGNKESKVSLHVYADDTTFIHDNSSAVSLFALLDQLS